MYILSGAGSHAQRGNQGAHAPGSPGPQAQHRYANGSLIHLTISPNKNFSATRVKQSDARIGLRLSEETKAKMSAKRKLYYQKQRYDKQAQGIAVCAW